jgi:hypothetical protein
MNAVAREYLIQDRDSIFAHHLDDSIRALGLAVLRAPFASPKANAIRERVIGTIGHILRSGRADDPTENRLPPVVIHAVLLRSTAPYSRPFHP